MGERIKLKIGNVKRAFDAEAGRLSNGEPSRYLPGFTQLEVISENSRTVNESWNVYYVAKRIRDNKLYGYTFRDSFHSYYGAFYRARTNPDETVVFVEMEKKTYTVTYFEEV
jgi:hypothetical protein